MSERLSINNGEPMRLVYPFTRIAVKDGAIQMWADNGAVLMVPGDARAFLTGIVTESDDQVDARPYPKGGKR